MGDIDINIDQSSDISVALSQPSDIAAALSQASDIAITIPFELSITDQTAPAFDSAEIGTVDRLTLVVTMDEDLADVTPEAEAFVVAGIYGIPSVSDVSISGSDITLTLSSAAYYGETITVSYTKPESNPLQDEAGNQVDSFSGEAVTNNVTLPLMDSGKGTYETGIEDVSTYGTNVVTAAAGILTIQYVNTAWGAYLSYFRATQALAVDLTPGQQYRFSIRAKSNDTNNKVNVYNGTGFETGVNLDVDYSWKHINFTCNSAIGGFVRMGAMGAGDIINIDRWYIQTIL